jgi:quercetin dioxygenase-like cupin family protein
MTVDASPFALLTESAACLLIDGRAELEIEGQRVRLEPGDSWVVPKGLRHRYIIAEGFTAVEVPSPPAEKPER